MFASFMINTWITVTIIAVTAGILGFFVVIRRSAFAAHALPLGTFPGASAAYLLGIPPIWGFLGAVGVSVLLLQQLERLGRKDVATGLLLVAGLALGDLFLSQSKAYASSVFRLLFGQILGVSTYDMLVVVGISVIVTAGAICLFRRLLLQSAFPELALTRGISAGMTNLMFLALLGLVTATAMPVVGALLVFSLLVAPAATAQTLSAHPIRALALSIVLSVAMIWSAIVFSFWTDWPIGFFVGATGAVLFCAARIFRYVRNRWWSRRRSNI